MNGLLRVLVAIGVVAASGAAYLYWQDPKRDIPATPIPADPVTPPSPAATPRPRFPIPVPSPEEATREPVTGTSPDAELTPPPAEDVPPEPLPALNESTRPITEVLGGMFTAETLNAVFNTEEFVRRFVLTVDTLPNAKLPRQNLLFKRVPGAFQVDGTGEERVIAAANAQRYAPYVQLAQRIETQRLVNIYQRFYPLFQEAYVELGNPNAYFNDRVVEVIDHLLDTPAVDAPLRVVQPKVFFQYADPELERLSAGQKALLRMGSANAAQIKAKLREVRAALTGSGGERGSGPAE